MVFSDRVVQVCREYNRAHAFKGSKGLSESERELEEIREQTINYCLGTLGISCVRDTSGYITGFEIFGTIREVLT